jgi:hypothetical protein
MCDTEILGAFKIHVVPIVTGKGLAQMPWVFVFSFFFEVPCGDRQLYRRKPMRRVY